MGHVAMIRGSRRMSARVTVFLRWGRQSPVLWPERPTCTANWGDVTRWAQSVRAACPFLQAVCRAERVSLLSLRPVRVCLSHRLWAVQDGRDIHAQVPGGDAVLHGSG